MMYRVCIYTSQNLILDKVIYFPLKDLNFVIFQTHKVASQNKVMLIYIVYHVCGIFDLVDITASHVFLLIIIAFLRLG